MQALWLRQASATLEMEEELTVQALMYVVWTLFNYFAIFEPLYFFCWQYECLSGLWKWGCFSCNSGFMISNTRPLHFWSKWKCTMEPDQVWPCNCVLQNWTIYSLMLSLGCYARFVWAMDRSYVIQHKVKPMEGDNIWASTFSRAMILMERNWMHLRSRVKFVG